MRMISKVALAALLALLPALPAAAQTGTLAYKVTVADCATLVYTPANKLMPTYVDTTGKECGTGPAAQLPTGAATAAKQDTGNTSLASILAKIIAAPATEAKQDTTITSLTSILNAISPSASASAGVAPVVAGSAASSAILKASPGNLYNVYFTAGSTPVWGMVFNAISLPGDGSTTAGIASGNLQDCILVPANTTQSINYSGAPPEVFTVGITAAASSTACPTLTASATAFIHGSAK